jgi:hypothetical protein
MKQIHLVVHNAGNEKYRFYIPFIYSKSIFKTRKQKVLIKIRGNEFNTHTTCGPKSWNEVGIGIKKGYDLYSIEISNWIIQNNYHKKINNQCKILFFKIKRIRNIIILDVK